MIVQHDANSPLAFSDTELLRDTNTLQTIIQTNDTQWRVALRNLSVPNSDIDTAVSYIRPHFTAEVYRDAYHPTGATRTFLFPNAERYQSLTREKTAPSLGGSAIISTIRSPLIAAHFTNSVSIPTTPTRYFAA